MRPFILQRAGVTCYSYQLIRETEKRLKLNPKEARLSWNSLARINIVTYNKQICRYLTNPRVLYTVKISTFDCHLLHQGSFVRTLSSQEVSWCVRQKKLSVHL